jgi:hypothetical protein
VALGGLKPDTLRQLRKFGKAIDARSSSTLVGYGASRVVSFDAQVSLSPGTRLMREWNGSTELVDVVEGGFVWRGNSYKTLSATSGAITGTKWSGPKFFGLLGPKATNSKRNRTPRSLFQGEAA